MRQELEIEPGGRKKRCAGWRGNKKEERKRKEEKGRERERRGEKKKREEVEGQICETSKTKEGGCKNAGGGKGKSQGQD